MSEVFSALRKHILNSDVLLDHTVLLLKLIANTYLSVHFFPTGKVYIHRFQGDKVGSILSKTVIFKGQLLQLHDVMLCYVIQQDYC
jgi:hypothetical protein